MSEVPERPLSFYSQDKVEYLDEHLETTRQYLEKIFSKEGPVIHHRVTTIFSELFNVEVPYSILKEIILLAGYLHDIGKAAEFYQREYEDVKRGRKQYISFEGHEVCSSVVVYEICREYLSNSIGYEAGAGLSRVVAAAILQHHHAMRTVRDIVSEKVLQLLRRGVKSWKPHTDHVNYIKKMVEGYLPETKYAEKVLSVLEQDINDFIDKIKEIIKSSGPELAILPLITAPLVIADRLAAKEKRGGRYTTLEYEAKALLEYDYLTNSH